jgi:hypothetical protein
MSTLLTIILALVLLGGAAYLLWNPEARALRSLRRDFAALQQGYQNLAREFQTMRIEQEGLSGKYLGLVEQYNLLNSSYQELDAAYLSLSEENQKIALAHQLLSDQYNELNDSHAILSQEYDLLMSEYEAINETAITPPYIYIHGRYVDMTFNLTDGSLERWEVPFDVLESSINRGYTARASLVRKTFTDDNGGYHRVVDMTRFIDPAPFNKVIPEIYAKSGSDEAFIREIWHILTQLTTYSEEIEETPRYPLETLLAGGGDCEDTAILMASMLLAAHTGWEVDLVYMDLDHPTQPQAINHAIVAVKTGTSTYLIETTSKTEMMPFGSGVRGWHERVQ